MTECDLTRSLIFLNLEDVDGLIDIARSGEAPITELQTDLIKTLSRAIVKVIADGKLDTTELFEGEIAIEVHPIEALFNVPDELVSDGERRHENN